MVRVRLEFSTFLKDGNCYELTIQGPGGVIPFGALIQRGLQLIVGTGLVLAGSVSYLRSYPYLSSVLLGASAGFVIPRLLWLVGLIRWSMWMQGLPQVLIAIVAIVLILSLSRFIIDPDQ